MDIKKDIKNGVKLASDAATDVLQGLFDKSRMRANANRIRQVIKSDTEIRNQAYIELGRYVYENMRDTLDGEYEELCVVVDKTSKRIDKATTKYIECVAMANDLSIKKENTDSIKKAVMEKVSLAKEKTSAFASSAKEIATDTTNTAKEAIVDIAYKAKEKVESIKVSLNDTDEIEAMIFDDEEKSESSQTNSQVNNISQTEDEESPDDFDF